MDESPGLEGPLFVLRTVGNAALQVLIWLFSWIFALLSLLLSPVLYLANSILAVVSLPFRIFLKFEAFLYYIIGAVVTGIAIGSIIYFLGHALSQLLQLHTTTASPPAEYYDNIKKESIDWESKWDTPLPKLSSAIVEEEENSQDST